MVIMFLILCFQAIIAQVNHAIGATGVVSQECKTLVSEYGEVIIDMLLSKVYVPFKHVIVVLQSHGIGILSE